MLPDRLSLLTAWLQHPWGQRLAALLLGLAGVLCFAPFGLWWLAFPVWLGLFALLRAAPSMRAAALLGGLFGAGFFLAGVSWVYVSLSVFGGMPAWLAGIATLLFCLAMALYPALLGALFKRWQPAGAVAAAFWFAALWAAGDWLRGWLFTGFPWLALGYAHAPGTPLAGFAPVLGVYGLSLLGALGAALLLRWRVGVPALLGLWVVGHGLAQVAWTTPVGAPLSVALAQGNVPQSLKWDPTEFFRTLRLYRDLVDAHPAQLTVLPETAAPAFYDQLPREFLADLQRLALRQQGDLILGTVSGNAERYWNTAYSFGVAPTQTYSKAHLVPFGEFIPPGFRWFLQVASIPMSEFARGENQQPLAIAGQQVAVNICYEDVFGEEIIRALPQATLLVNMSNTAWFGDSLAQPQHLQISQMRALESGRPMLRATNTGMTAVIAPDGRVQAALPPFTTGVLMAEVQGYQGMTPYARWGNWAALGLMLLLAAFSRIRARR